MIGESRSRRRLIGGSCTIADGMAPSDDLAYAIKISPSGSDRICAAAGIEPPEWQDREWAEIDVRRQLRSLASRSLEDVITDADIASRRTYRCAVCAGTFTIQQFDDVRRRSRERHEPRPFETSEPIHVDCRTSA